MTHIKTLVVAALVALVFVTGAAGDDGLPLNTGFKVPVIVQGKLIQGKAFIDNARVMRIFYVLNNEIEGPILYTVVRGGDVQPDPEPKPPIPTPGKPNKVFVLWETKNVTPEGVAIANLVRRSDGWKKEAERLGINLVIADVSEAEKPYPGATKAAKAQGIPALVWGRDNVLLGTDKLPKDEPAMLKLLREKGGAS
jgi:hypothetical protein